MESEGKRTNHRAHQGSSQYHKRKIARCHTEAAEVSSDDRTTSGEEWVWDYEPDPKGPDLRTGAAPTDNG